jgi:hypothetical protein
MQLLGFVEQVLGSVRAVCWSGNMLGPSVPWDTSVDLPAPIVQ